MSSLATPNNEDSATHLLKSASARRQGLPTCDKCGATIDSQGSMVCRSCGWYASIGSYVEIDQNWECDSTAQTQQEQPLKMPEWGWVMIGCVVAVVAESIAARVLTADAARTRWSVTQLFVGGSLLAVCHLTAFILLMREVSDAQLLDIILKPIKPWIRRFHELPEYQWISHTAVSSLVAVLMAVIVIGGIPYEKLLDWGFKKPVKKDLMGAIMEEVNKGEGEEKPLEEAVQDFAGKAGTDDTKKPKTKPKTEPKERKQDDCVIIGYRENSEGLAYVLLLAGENYGKLQYVGQVTPQLSVKELRELSNQLAAIKTFDPFVRIEMEGVTWVQPKVTCRVSYARKGKKGGLYDIKLESLMGEIETIAPPVEEPKEKKAQEE
jgi:hypothetical protein